MTGKPTIPGAGKALMPVMTFAACATATCVRPWAGSPVARWRVALAVIYGLCAVSAATSRWWLPKLSRPRVLGGRRWRVV